VIISTDPGIDDSIALLVAGASPELDLRAVCVDFGSLHNMTRLAHNAMAVLHLADRDDVPVYLGAGDPVAMPFHDLGGPNFHGQDGLGGVELEVPAGRTVNTTLTAPELIAEACRTWDPKPLLVSLSPLANIALALALEPELPTLCPDLYLMGGTVLEPGNVSPLAEANIANDAEAARRVFAAGFKNINVAPLDITMHTWLSNDFLESIDRLPGRVGPFVWNITRFYTNAYRVVGGFADGGMPLHDPSALFLYLRPELFEFQTWPIDVDTSPYPNPTRGMYIADRRGGPLSPPPAPGVPTAKFAMKVNSTAVQAFLKERLSLYSAQKIQAEGRRVSHIYTRTDVGEYDILMS